MSAEIKRRCFVISPIGEEGSPFRQHADMVLNSIIKPALADFDVKRADDLNAPDMISDKVIDALLNYEIAIADLTFLNPNVFYELAVRHMIERPVIHIAANGTTLPFDNYGVTTTFFNVLDWHSHARAREAISSAVVSNPVTQSRA